MKNFGWIAMMAAVPLFSQELTFFEGFRDWIVGANPMAVALGDFNGDGKPDLVTANADDGTISVLLNNGNKTFQRKRDFATGGTGTTPYSVATGDFNGDGKLDVAVANHGTGSVAILLGRGDGTFQTALNTVVAAGDQPLVVVVADFNGDGKRDVVVAETTSGGGDVSILLGNGDGTLQAPRVLVTGLATVTVATGDFNKDGKADLVVGNVDSSNMAVLIGKGDGTFQAAVNYPVGMYGQLLALGDFNGDGIPDLAVDGCQPTKPATFAIAALVGNGDGTFQPAVVNVMGETGCTVPLAFGDFNADGWDDLVFPDYSTYGTTVLQSEGNGKFVRRSETPTGGYFISGVITGDFNGDGKPDAVTVNNRFANNISLLVGAGDCQFYQPPHFKLQENELVAADFNGDGLTDLASPHEVWLGNSTGVPGPAMPYRSPFYSSLAAGDFNGDSKLDLVGGTYRGELAIALGNGDGTFQASTKTGLAAAQLAVGDFNQDGKLDVAGLDKCSVYLNQGNGDGTFRAVSATGTDGCYAIAAADFNGDGNLDILTAGSRVKTDVTLMLGNGDGTFRRSSVDVGRIPEFMAAGDFNGDGKADFAIISYYSNSGEFGTVTIFLSNGDGTFQAPRGFSMGTVAQAGMNVADVNGDGKLDLIFSAVDAGSVSVLLGNGDGSFEAPRLFAAYFQPSVVAVGDFNGDGKPDMAINSGVTILINTTPPK